MAVCVEAPRRIAHIAADRRPTSDATRWSALTVSVSSCFFSSSSSSSSRVSFTLFFVLVIDKTKQFNYLINWLLNCLHIMHIIMFFFLFFIVSILYNFIFLSLYFCFILLSIALFYLVFLLILSLYVFILFLFVLYKSIPYMCTIFDPTLEGIFY